MLQTTFKLRMHTVYPLWIFKILWVSNLVIDKSCINIHKFCCDKITSVIYPKKIIFEKENSYVQKYNIAICLVSEKFRKYLTAEEQKNKMIY